MRLGRLHAEVPTAAIGWFLQFKPVLQQLGISILSVWNCPHIIYQYFHEKVKFISLCRGRHLWPQHSIVTWLRSTPDVPRSRREVNTSLSNRNLLSFTTDNSGGKQKLLLLDIKVSAIFWPHRARARSLVPPPNLLWISRTRQWRCCTLHTYCDCCFLPYPPNLLCLYPSLDVQELGKANVDKIMIQYTLFGKRGRPPRDCLISGPNRPISAQKRDSCA